MTEGTKYSQKSKINASFNHVDAFFFDIYLSRLVLSRLFVESLDNAVSSQVHRQEGVVHGLHSRVQNRGNAARRRRDFPLVGHSEAIDLVDRPIFAATQRFLKTEAWTNLERAP